MRIAAEIALLLAVWLAVLAFGGAEPRAFAIAQLLIFGAALLLVWQPDAGWGTQVRYPGAVTALLLAVVLAQLIPLPVEFVRMVRAAPLAPLQSSWETTSIEPHRTGAHLLQLVAYLAAFFVTVWVCRAPGSRQRLLGCVLGLGALEAFYGLTQYLTGWHQIFAYVNRYAYGRATGTYVNANHFAALLEMLLPLALTMALFYALRLRESAVYERDWRRVVRSRELPKAGFHLFLAVVLFLALVFSGSRMGLLSAVTALAVILFWAATRAMKARVAVLLAGLFALGGASLAAWIGVGPVLERFGRIDGSAVVRGAIWQDASGLATGSLWLGTGLGTFPVAFTPFQTTALDLFVNHAHNDYLELTAELGLPGSLLIFGSLACLLVRLLAASRRPSADLNAVLALGCVGSILGILLHSLADFNLYLPANALMLAVLSGLGYAASEGVLRRAGLPAGAG